MADISLRDYLAKLDTLLDDGTSDEVVHHCRHILQYFPKNVETYRCLGRALVYAGNWGQAGEVFRRVLSVYPDDYIAHAGLSEVYANLKRPDEAIWHLERAFEQDPNNQAIIDDLRELYRKHRRVEQAKLQLTAGAVARQYIRNSLYEQAIDTLRQTLENHPERVDLRLLLARTYNDGGYRVEAGETALEVLQMLPDCLDCNRILTELWLSVQRPSDAQHYLNRIQTVDPYLALELALGQPVPDDKFRLEELDYRSSAQREMISRAPDWLQAIEPAEAAEPEAEAADWMSGVSVVDEAEIEPAAPQFEDDFFSTDLPDDWLADQPADQPAVSTPGSGHTGLTGLLATLNADEEAPAEPADVFDMAAEAEVESAPPDAADLDLFPDMEPEPPGEAEPAPPDFSDLLAGAAEPEAPPEAEAAPPVRGTGGVSEADPLAWLHGSGIELLDEPEAEASLFDDDEDVAPVQTADEVNPLAWLQSYGGEELIVEDEAEDAGFAAEAMDSPTTDEIAGWLREQEEADTGSLAAPASAPAAADPLDWLADESLLEEALSLEALTGAAADDEVLAEDALWAQDSTPVSERQEPMAEENPLAWLNSPQDDEQPLGDGEQPESLSGKDWFSDMSAADEEPAEAAGDSLEWLSFGDEEAIEEEAAEAAEAMPDWLAQMEPADDEEPVEEEAAEAAEAMPDWLAQMEPAGDEEAESAEIAPDWLTQMHTAPVEEAPEAGDEFAWMGELVEEEAEPEAAGQPWATEAVEAEQDIEFGLEEEAEAEPEAADAGQIWTGGAVEQAREVDFGFEEEAEAEPEAADAGQVWSGGAVEQAREVEFEAEQIFGFEEEAEAEPAEIAPDWLTQMQASTVEEAPEAGDEFAWMGELVEEEAEVEEAEEAEAAADAGEHWAGGAVEQAREVQFELEDEFEFEEEAEVEAEPAGAMPDWLAQMEPADESEAEPAGAMPDWMSALDEPEVAAAMPEVEDTGSDFDWDYDDTEAGKATEAPDWLSSIQPAGEAEAEPEMSGAPASEFSWIDDINAADADLEEMALVEPETFEAALEFEAEAQFAEPPQAQSESEIDAALQAMLEFEDAEEEIIPAAPSNAPDWLNAMVPGLDMDFDAPEDQPIEQSYVDDALQHRVMAFIPDEDLAEPQVRRDFDWLVEIVDEETRQVPAVRDDGERKRFVFSRLPAWLRRPVEQRDDSQDQPQAADTDEPFDDSDLPSWLR